MTWLAWRRHRSMLTVLLTCLVFAAMALALRPLGVHELPFGFTAHDLREAVEGFLWALPALIGIFLAVPASAGELERHTHRFIWSQTISRDRWLGTHLTVFGMPALLGVAVLGLLYRWVDWGDPYADRLWMTEPLLLPLVYTLFAITLGMTSGLLLRRTVPAMAVTLGVFTFVRYAIDRVQPYLFPREVVTAALGEVPPRYPSLPEDSAIVASGLLDSAGNLLSYAAGNRCASNDFPCLREQGITGHWLSYHPAEAYWGLQLLEAGLYLAGATLLFGGAFYLLRKRSTA